MAIDTDTKKYALLAFGRTTEPMRMPIGGGSWSADDQQQVLWGYPGILWAAGVALTFVLDLNTRIMVYLRDLYGVTGGDLATLTTRYLNSQTGEGTARFKKLIKDATDAMS